MNIKQWLAGFWEGDGSAGSYRYKTVSRHTGKPYYARQCLRVSFTQKAKAPLLHIKRQYGGTLGRYKGSAFNHDLYYKYDICSLGARKLLTDILPYVVSPTRKARIRKALTNDAKWINRKHWNANKQTAGVN